MLFNGRMRTSSYEGRTAKKDFLFLVGPAAIGAALTAGVTTESGREGSQSNGAAVKAEGGDGLRIVTLTAERHKQVQHGGYYCTRGKL